MKNNFKSFYQDSPLNSQPHLNTTITSHLHRNTLRQSLLNKMSDKLPSLKTNGQRISYRGPQHEELNDLQIRAKNYLFKYKIINDPFTTFSLMNIILEQRQRIQKQKNEKNENNIVKQCNDGNVTTTKFFPSIHNNKSNSKLQLNQDRQDVLDLAKWLDNKLEKLKAKDVLELHDILDYKQSVVNLAVAQIVRMVSKNCKELGRLLKLVFDSTFEVFQKVLQLLLKNNNHKQQETLHEQKTVQKLYDQRLKNQIQEKQKVSKQLQFILQNFKKLIVANRRLKKQKKDLNLQFKMNQYSLESYRQGYSIALQMALQSSDTNILNWAKKILSKLIRDKKQRHHKNIQQIKVDNQIFKQAREVVFNWLRRNVDQYQPQYFEKFQKIDLYQDHVQKIKKTIIIKQNANTITPSQPQLQKLQTDKNQIKKLTTRLNSKKNEVQISQIQRGGKENIKNKNYQIDWCRKIKIVQSDEQEKQINIYDYFKCYDVGTSMDIEYADKLVGEHVLQHQRYIQTEGPQVHDVQVQANLIVERFDQSGLKNKFGEQFHMEQCQNRSESDVLTSLNKVKQKNKKKLIKKDSSGFSIQRLITHNSIKIGGKNMVQVKYRKGRGILLSKDKNNQNFMRRRNSLIYINQSKQNIEFTRQLELKKFSDIFQQQQNILMKNPAGFIRSIQSRRSYYVDAQVQYMSYKDYVQNNKIKIIFRKVYRNQGATNQYGEISKKVKHILQKNQNTSNLMKLKTFKQNQLIFSTIYTDIHEIKIRQQKIPSVLNIYCKLLSSLIIDYVKSIKKQKEDKGDDNKDKFDKFFYPLNVLFVDRFIHTYGLRDIAQKNMKNTLSTMVGLLEKSDPMRLFFWLLGCNDKNVAGDQLQIYVRCLVYFDTSGKISLNQATMKDFNIDKLTTDRICIKQSINKATEGFFQNAEAEQLLSIISNKLEQFEIITIQQVALIIIQHFLNKRSSLEDDYMPIYNFLTRNNQFLSNLVQFVKYLKLGIDRQGQIIRYFSNNQDLVQDNSRSITAPHFLSCCIRIGFPTISIISQYLLDQLKMIELPKTLLNNIDTMNEYSFELLMHVKYSWKINLDPYIIKQIQSNKSSKNCKLTEFWWRFQLFKLVQGRIYENVNIIIDNLKLINMEAYTLIFKKK